MRSSLDYFFFGWATKHMRLNKECWFSLGRPGGAKENEWVWNRNGNGFGGLDAIDPNVCREAPFRGNG